MIPVVQQKLMDETDAYRAALASLLEIELEEIPAFTGLNGELKLHAWLSDLNLAVVRVSGFQAPPMLWIARTQSPYPGYAVHSVVMRAAVLLHDPHPEPQPFDQTTILGADIITPADPSLPSGRFVRPSA